MPWRGAGGRRSSPVRPATRLSVADGDWACRVCASPFPIVSALLLARTRVADAGSKRKMVRAGAGHDPAPDPRYPPWRGRGRQPCTGLQFVLPLVRKSPVSRLSRCVIGAHTSRQGCGHRGGARRVQMHDSGELVHPADVRSVRARLSDRRARCLRASASSLCVGCC